MVLENVRNKCSVLGLQYEPKNLDVNKIYFAMLPDISNMLEESNKNQSVTG